jgi:hypothetical protein
VGGAFIARGQFLCRSGAGGRRFVGWNFFSGFFRGRGDIHRSGRRRWNIGLRHDGLFAVLRGQNGRRQIVAQAD